MNICFFEDEKTKGFKPLTLTRPMDDLRVGVLTISEKWKIALGADAIGRIAADHLDGVFETGSVNTDTKCIWVNARFLPNEEVVNEIQNLSDKEMLVKDGEVLAACANGNSSVEVSQNGQPDFKAFKERSSGNSVSLNYLWDMLSNNAKQIQADIHWLGLKAVKDKELNGDPVLQGKDQIFIHPDATIEPGCIFIANEGPVLIQENVTIEAGSIIRGPVAIGRGATIKAGARISGGTTIGPVCKVGGEVSNCIFHSYSNKAHEGFTGNSIFGQWVNLGADTNTSNLKNNYKNVSVIDWESKEALSTDQQFLGTIMGDHSKTAINTMLNTGTMCGVSSNIFLGGFPPRVIDSFTWLGPEGPVPYRFDKALEVMERMMERRNVKLSQAYQKMMKAIKERA